MTICIDRHTICYAIVLILMFLSALFAFPVDVGAVHDPEPDPPTAVREQTEPPLSYPSRRTTPPTIEWGYHKTADNAHPDANEQEMVWLMNRARANPEAEGIWLATTDEPDIAESRDAKNVDLELLQSEFASYAPKPPAAFDVRLYQAAKAHSDYMIAQDAQNHDQQLDRVDDAGFAYTTWGGNVFSYSESALHAHAGFNIDWGGNDGSGMQPGRGHRLTLMSVDEDFVKDFLNVGIAAVPESNDSTEVGPLVVTGNYAKANTATVDHFNRFIVGTVWEDTNCNNRYDAGEGIGDVTVMPDHGDYYAVTSDSGGYAIPILTAGTYQVTFSGGTIPDGSMKSVDVATESVLLDYTLSSVPVSDITVASTETCVGTVVFEDNSYPCATAWNWSFPSGSPSTSTEKSPSVTYTEPGAYTATLTASNEQGEGTTATETIQVYAVPSSTCAVQTENLDNLYWMGIFRVIFGDIDHGTEGAVNDGGYQDFTCSHTAALEPETAYDLSVEVGFLNEENVAVYIDYDNNGSFEASERVFSSGSAVGVHSGTVTTPADPVMDTLLRMRVMSDSGSIPGGCTAPEAGQVEDYSVIFRSAPSAPLIDISPPSAAATADADVTFTVTYTYADTISLTSGDISLIRTGSADATVSVSGTGNTSRTILLSDIQGEGTLGITIPAGTGTGQGGTTSGAASDSIIVDNTPPVVSIASPADGSVLYDDTPLLDYAVTEANPGSTTLKVDDQTVDTASGQPLSILSSGSHTLSVAHTDAAGHETMVLSTFEIVLSGDIDGSGTVDLVDAVKVLQVLVGITPDGDIDLRAGVSSGDRIEIQDAIYILQYVAGR